ncbi:hypothetical protein [Heyndrickxia ginsengihumi]|uniref:hypothetical protein n=1 Tax=Heyndrickxia ginsengihumi TaxID=363870 RepID=UPI003D1B4D60
MESPNIFSKSKKNATKNNSLINPIVRDAPKKNSDTAPRRKRSDKKHDIKINLTPQQRAILKQLAKKWDESMLEKISSTYVCTKLLEQGLQKSVEFPFPSIQYPKSDSRKGRAKLTKKYYDLLFEFTLKWDCSYAKAAHRILSYILDIEGEKLR